MEKFNFKYGMTFYFIQLFNDNSKTIMHCEKHELLSLVSEFTELHYGKVFNINKVNTKNTFVFEKTFSEVSLDTQLNRMFGLNYSCDWSLSEDKVTHNKTGLTVMFNDNENIEHDKTIRVVTISVFRNLIDSVCRTASYDYSSCVHERELKQWKTIAVKLEYELKTTSCKRAKEDDIKRYNYALNLIRAKIKEADLRFISYKH